MSRSPRKTLPFPRTHFAEALSIFDRKRINFDFRKLFTWISKSENYVIVSLDLSILEKMIGLKDVPELHDKIIVSTAKYLNLPLITKDAVLQKLSHIKTVW